ncbi:alpha/beta-hydrolase [Coprinellus micaceus]|uniref:Alpha/beta-hydrolase n=1 Tax=Coprinellus micaceus TaxID=71717 RepID=A0A4Y7SIQ6_COPMI|nr:alpha/beta-hydrolase [Coprinellus micaceus]
MRFLNFFASISLVLPYTLAIPHDHSSESSPVLAGPIGPDCITGVTYEGREVGTNVTIAGVPTYLSIPSPEPEEGTPKKVILFFSDVYSAFHVNNMLLQDWFASQGFYVAGLDYFFGDPIQAHDGEPGFNQAAWLAKSQRQAEEALPKWLEAVRETYGRDAKYGAVGYCFGGPYALRIAATEDVVASAFAHPAFLTESDFAKITKPLLLSCAETDSTFPRTSLYRATDILAQNKKQYHVQVFSGVSHGFATRADPNDPNAVWAKEQSARGVVEWFNRFGNSTS